VFSHMEATFIWGILFSAIACGAAIAADGRGRHGLKVLLGMAPRTENLNAYDDVPRPDEQWDFIGYINDPRIMTGEIPLRAITARAEAPSPGRAEGKELVLASGPANMLRAPAKMPPTVRPRAREAMPASS
jgi:hypothetical protein